MKRAFSKNRNFGKAKGANMKKTVKRALLVFAGIFILAIGIVVVTFLPMMSMNPAETGKIPNTNIYGIRNKMNAVYFIKTDAGYIMIDAGSDSKKIEASIKESGIDFGVVKWILLTHSDYDHVDSLALFPNAAIYMNEDELPMVNGTVKRNILGKNKMPAGIDINTIILLKDGQELSFGGTNIKCIKAPGHTPGSMVYLMDGKYLFTGDAFKLKNGKLDVHPFTMDAKLAKKTIEQLKTAIDSAAIVFTAHYGIME